MPPKKTKPVSFPYLFILLIIAFPGLRDLRMGGADCVAGERDELTVSLVQEGGADCVAPLVHLQLTVSLEIFAALTVSRSNTALIPYVPTRFFSRYSLDIGRPMVIKLTPPLFRPPRPPKRSNQSQACPVSSKNIPES
jgi:hypothetical protein